jgi:hypothetical protein
MARLTQWATGAGIDRLWVATGEPAFNFYRRCGFEVTEVVRGPDQDQPTILTSPLGRPPTGTAL